ncbi:MAG: hypothetical protein K6E27_14185 [Eubacterium sp.]|nr:hypothetical protein [Eubacterium sp.]
MNYKVNNEYKCEFENVKRIGIGTGKIFYVYKDNMPFLSVEINLLIGDFFVDSIIVGEYLYIGNYYEGVYVINLKDFSFNNISVDGYFGYFVKNQEYIYILGCESIIAIDIDARFVWKSDSIAVDGIVCNGIEGHIMYISCEMDPPGGWEDMKIDLLTGNIINSK